MKSARQNPEKTNSKKRDNGAGPGDQEAAPWEAGVKPRKTEHHRNKKETLSRGKTSQECQMLQRGHTITANCPLD